MLDLINQILDFITHIYLITVIAWCLTELWDMPGQAIRDWKQIKKAQGNGNSTRANR